jgi:hypothetical protein
MRQIASKTVIERVEAMVAAADCFTLLPAAAAR